MKHIITAKYIKDNLSVTNPQLRTEICTEMISSRLKLIDMLQAGQVSKSDCIVTRIDRKCLYENLFDHVISWDDYALSRNQNEIDLAGQILKIFKELPYKPVYQNFERDKNLIFSIKLSSLENFDLSKPFICILVRKTPNHPEKNLPDLYWEEMIEFFLQQTNGKYNIFTFGQGVNLKNKNHKHIDNFQDWCSIMSKENCQCVLSTISGGVYPIFFTGHKNNHLIIIDNGQQIKIHGHDPSFYNECINFTKVKKTFLYHIPNYEELTKTILEK